ncbi:MAG: hypothetical protein ACPGUV_10770 [Polyangiales bacterium]
MLPPHIIDELARHERERRREHQQPLLELELPLPCYPRKEARPSQPEVERGVIEIDLWGES